MYDHFGWGVVVIAEARTFVRRWVTRGSGILSAVFLAACASGPAFVALEAPAADRAAIYVYRDFALGGAAIGYPVSLNGQSVGTLAVNSFVRAETDPQATRATVSGPACVSPQTIAITPGESVFVEAVVEMSSLRSASGYMSPDYRCRLVQRSQAEALKSLSGLKRAQ